MRWRVAAMIAVSGMAAIPAVSDALQPRGSSVKVSVKPRVGSTSSHFAVRFRAAVSTGRSFHNLYRITAGGPRRSGCQSNATVVAPPSRAGSTVHVTLAPRGSKRWCAGPYRGQVWEVIIEPCPFREACPAIQPLPALVGKFSFRVTRG